MRTPRYDYEELMSHVDEESRPWFIEQGTNQTAEVQAPTPELAVWEFFRNKSRRGRGELWLQVHDENLEGTWNFDQLDVSAICSPLSSRVESNFRLVENALYDTELIIRPKAEEWGGEKRYHEPAVQAMHVCRHMLMCALPPIPEDEFLKQLAEVTASMESDGKEWFYKEPLYDWALPLHDYCFMLETLSEN